MEDTPRDAHPWPWLPPASATLDEADPSGSEEVPLLQFLFDEFSLLYLRIM